MQRKALDPTVRSTQVLSFSSTFIIIHYNFLYPVFFQLHVVYTLEHEYSESEH
jgi:hypothetical protein